MDRPVLGAACYVAVHARKPRWVIGSAIRLAAFAEPGHPPEYVVPHMGLGSARSDANHSAGAGGRVDVYHAEDDHHARHGPKARVYQQDDAVHDAASVRLLHPTVSERARPLLGCFQRGWSYYPGVCYRMGPDHFVIFIPTLTGSDYARRRCRVCASVVDRGD